ncbi:ammonium transporter [Paenibacillus tyrfis]|uniref:Ammonium transporter AmtB-like domain-containing protein n=1 Tax=Paenibacillus tyrfis TaxID=1501230 RepID=A0A081NX57_9BACL|nr:ammonium transporter [Paenibacillus tyrfis]KEQ23030.1 hypothetical protein ET33_19140 [Paenibacillus tyrfis]
MIWGFVTTWIAFKLINQLVSIRVSGDEKLVGLDVVIHGVPATANLSLSENVKIFLGKCSSFILNFFPLNFIIWVNLQ